MDLQCCSYWCLQPLTDLCRLLAAFLAVCTAVELAIAVAVSTGNGSSDDMIRTAITLLQADHRLLQKGDPHLQKTKHQCQPSQRKLDLAEAANTGELYMLCVRLKMNSGLSTIAVSYCYIGGLQLATQVHHSCPTKLVPEEHASREDQSTQL